MPKPNPAGAASRVLALLIVAGAAGLAATSRARLPPSLSAASRASETPVVDHVPGGGPDGGAVSSLVVVDTRPATVFAAFERGGVFKSSDRGATWKPADRGLPGDGFCELAAVPTDASTLYAACGDGLFKTTNGGALWRQLDLDNPLPPVVAPSDARVVYQPPVHGVVRSSDGGRRWEQIHGAMPTRCASAFAIDPVDPLVLYCGDDQWVKVSRDGGATWTSPARTPGPDLEIAALAIDPSERHTIVAGTSDGRTFKTTTGGATWNFVATGPAEGAIEHLQFVGTSGDVLFARQGSSILRSLDRGDSWRALSAFGPADLFGAFAVDPRSPSTVFVGTNDGVMVTTDFGGHWTRRHAGITRATASVVVHADATASTLYASSGRALFVSRDAGDHWEAFRPSGALADVAIVSLQSDGASGVVARTAAGAYRMRRGEAAWVPLAAPAGSRAALRPIVSADRSPLFATTADAFVYSADGGDHWRSGRLPGDYEPTWIAVAAGEPRVIYASTGGPLGALLGQNGIWRTLDEGSTWQLVDVPPSHGIGHCCQLSADPNNRNTIYAIVVGVGIGGGGDLVRKTRDGGVTWAEVPLPGLALSLTALPTVPTTLLAQMSDFSILTSTDAGDSWVPGGADLPPNVEIVNIAADPRPPGRLFAGTNGRGVFRSLDAGASWRPTGSLR